MARTSASLRLTVNFQEHRQAARGRQRLFVGFRCSSSAACLYRAFDAARERPLSPGGDFAALPANDRFLSGPAARPEKCRRRLGVDLSRSAASFSSPHRERLGRVLDQIAHRPKQPPPLPPLRDRRHAPLPVLEAVWPAHGHTRRRSPAVDRVLQSSVTAWVAARPLRSDAGPADTRALHL